MTADSGEDSSIDPRLRALVGAAEQGRPVPSVGLVTGSWVIQGTPISTQQFLWITQSAVETEISQTKESQTFRGTKDELGASIREQTAPLFAAFGWPTPVDGNALSLGTVTVGGGIGAALRVPALRVPLTAVAAWWACPYVALAPRSGGGGGVTVSF
jgi:hypothetical protein